MAALAGSLRIFAIRSFAVMIGESPLTTTTS